MQFSPNQKAVSYQDAVQSLFTKGEINQRQVKIINEIQDLERKGIIGGFRIHAEFGGFLNTQNALAGKIAKYSKDKNLLTYSTKRV